MVWSRGKKLKSHSENYSKIYGRRKKRASEATGMAYSKANPLYAIKTQWATRFRLLDCMSLHKVYNAENPSLDQFPSRRGEVVSFKK
jgi:hypothetical protein